MFVAMLLCGITGVLIERLAYRRLRNAPRLAPLITAIGMSFILENIMQYWHGPSPVPFPQVIPEPRLSLGSVDIATKQILVVVLAVVHDDRAAAVHLSTRNSARRCAPPHRTATPRS